MEIKTVDHEQLEVLRRMEPRFKLVDVLDRDHYEKEHIDGAINLPLEEIGRRHRDFLNENDVIAVYCASFECQASTKAAEKLMKLGYPHVMDYKGGLKDCKESGCKLAGAVT
ncbi:MAG: rhodanese-like domain-containing protein [Candidatus Omnitrophica bacterium]|nr:rhodanese-like domain-containing protein [Candidatus Omnitrophota bacterium]